MKSDLQKFEHKIFDSEAFARKALEPLHRGLAPQTAREILVNLETELQKARCLIGCEAIVNTCDEYLRKEVRSTSLNDMLVHYMSRFPVELGDVCSACLSLITYDSVACGASRGRTSIFEISGCSTPIEVGLGEFYDEWTGCRVWPGAILMYEMLLKRELDVADADVLELGSGVGLTGIACMKAGARSMTFTEYKSSLLEVCFENARKNLGESATSRSVSGILLDWSDFKSDKHQEFTEWRSKLQGDFVVVGSELVYDETHAEMVIKVLFELFRAGARAGLIVVMKKPSRQGVDLFLRNLAQLEASSCPFICTVREIESEDGQIAACIHLLRRHL